MMRRKILILTAVLTALAAGAALAATTSLTVSGSDLQCSADGGAPGTCPTTAAVAAGHALTIKSPSTTTTTTTTPGPPLTIPLKFDNFDSSDFDSRNGSVVTSTEQAYSGTHSAKVAVQGETINRGWSWAQPPSYCAGSLAPVGSTRSIKAEFFVPSPSVHHNTRLVGLSYDRDCLGAAHSSMVDVLLDQGSVYLKTADYGGDCAGCDPTTLSPRVPIPANQWVSIEMRVHVARDSTGWGELLVNGISQGRYYANTMKTSWGDYNEVQWGAGWSEAGTPATYLYLDDATVSTLQRHLAAHHNPNIQQHSWTP
jgi:Polysaccharide lyase